MTTKNCKGCITIERCSRIEKNDSGCPCKICIVKMICKAACKEYLVFSDNIIIQKIQISYRRRHPNYRRDMRE